MAERQPTIEERIQAQLFEAPPSEDGTEQPGEQAVVKEPEEQPEVIEEATEEVTEEVTVEPEAEEVEPVTEETEPDEETYNIETLSDLATHINVEPSDLYNVKIPITNADGERQDITIGEFKDSVQNTELSRKAIEKAEQKYTEVEKRITEIEGAFEQQHGENAILLNEQEKAVKAQYDAINWEELRTSNPTEYNTKRLMFMDREKQITGMRQQARASYITQKDKIMKEMGKIKDEQLQQEADLLFKIFPKWEDRGVMVAEQAELRNYLLETGYTEDEINEEKSILQSDAKAISLAYKAMLYDRSKRNGKATKKKVAAIGNKVLKPSAKRSKATQKADAEQALRNKLRKSGRVEDATALISQRLNRG